jgi:general secretion pathway protein C
MTENKKSLLKTSAGHLRNIAKTIGSQFIGAKSHLFNKFKKGNSSQPATGNQPHFKENLKNFQEFSTKAIQNFDPQAAINWATKALKKPGTARYGTLATIMLSTYFAADLTALIVGEYIPNPPVVRLGRMGGPSSRQKSINDYGAIIARNLFNSQGTIPGEEKQGDGIGSSPTDLGGPPTKSALPLNLIGTLILENELRSIATIEDKAASAVYPVRVEDEIPDRIKVLKVEPSRVIFLNKSSGRREFLELPDENPGNPRLSVGRNTGFGGTPGIEKLAATQYNVSRSEVDKALADFNNILTQARAVPNIENGVASGYKLFQIVPGSIYDKLGLQNGDVVSGLNGNPINDPAKAFEMLSELKTSSHMELQVRKDGKSLTYTYDIH